MKQDPIPYTEEHTKRFNIGVMNSLILSLVFWAFIAGIVVAFYNLKLGLGILSVALAITLFLTVKLRKVDQDNGKPLKLTEILLPRSNGPVGFRKPSGEEAARTPGGPVPEVSRPWSVEYYTQQRGDVQASNPSVRPLPGRRLG